jgi:DNA polymerase-3 subunit gamma/tau
LQHHFVFLINALAEAGQGSMRAALSLTDQAIAFGQGAVTQNAVLQMLGTLAKGDLANLLSLSLNASKDSVKAALLTHLESLSKFNPNFEQALLDMAEMVFHIAEFQLWQKWPQDLYTEEDIERLAQLAGQLSADQVQVAYQLLLRGVEDIQLVPKTQVAFEMTLMRLITFVGQFQSTGAVTPAPRSMEIQQQPAPEISVAEKPSETVIAEAVEEKKKART